MDNFNLFTSSKYKMAHLLAVAEVGGNDFPNEIDKWFKWLNEKAEDAESECYKDDYIKKYLSVENREVKPTNDGCGFDEMSDYSLYLNG